MMKCSKKFPTEKYYNFCNYSKNQKEDKIQRIPQNPTPEIVNEPIDIISDSYPFELKELWHTIKEDEKRLGQSYEQLAKELQEKVSKKRHIKERMQQWDSFLNGWRRWDIDGIHKYLVQIKDKHFAKYFPSAKSIQLQWYNEHKYELKGSDLPKIDREDLQMLGVLNKDDRKILIDLIHNLCERK